MQLSFVLIRAMFKETLEIIKRAIIEEFNISAGGVAAHVKALSDSFTKKRNELPRNYLSDLDRRRAYIAGFLLPNAAKVLHCLNEASELKALSKNKKISMLDLGCGPATASLAASLFFGRKRRLSVTAVEQSKQILQDGKALFESLGLPGRTFEPIIQGITPSKINRELEARQFEIIVVGNLLNEFDDKELSFKLINGLITDHLTDDGVLIIIDPALKKTTRPIMAMRDRLLSAGGIDVMAPCLHMSDCPMLKANDRDWCHFYLEWKRPELIKQLDELTGLDRKHLKMSYFILRRTGDNSKTSKQNPKHWRVVSSPLISKGKRELMLCGACGDLKRVMRIDREASGANVDFEGAMRGDIIETDATKRIRADDSFRIIHKYNDCPSELTK